MSKSIVSILIAVFVFSLISTPLYQSAWATNLPRSNEGTLVESVSATEVLVRASGIGYWEKGMSKKKDREKFLTRSAEEDGRKAAVYFVLYGGTDPMLAGESQRSTFSKVQEDFFTLNNITKYIAWEGNEFESRVKKDIERKKKYELHIEKIYKVNKQLIEDDLNRMGILPAKEDVVEALGMPFVMVIPATKKGQNPIEILQANSILSHAANSIESFLTARKYDVVVPQQQQDLSSLSAAQMSLDDVEEDYSYQLALSIGSDVYITYEVNVEDDKHGTKKASASVRAYETTTARLLGTETGYSPSANTAPMVLVENAINDAIDKVLNRIMNYWKEDIERGVQYKLIISISDEFDKDDAEEISFVFLDLLESVTVNKQFKENIVTKSTLDYLLWCDAGEYDKPTRLYRDLKKRFTEEFPGGSIDKVNINRKLVLLKVTQ